VIEKLIRDDVEALSLWTAATKRPGGQRTDLVNNVHEVTPERPQGTSREAALRRLNKAAAEGNEEAVEAKLGEQRRFVLWWDAQGRGQGGRPPEKPSENDDGFAKLADFDLDRDEVHRWRKKLKDPRKFDAELQRARA
jgi:hypothetical protein